MNVASIFYKQGSCFHLIFSAIASCIWPSDLQYLNMTHWPSSPAFIAILLIGLVSVSVQLRDILSESLTNEMSRTEPEPGLFNVLCFVCSSLAQDQSLQKKKEKMKLWEQQEKFIWRILLSRTFFRNTLGSFSWKKKRLSLKIKWKLKLFKDKIECQQWQDEI